MQENEITKHQWKEIESGRYKDLYLVYNRKSTDEPDNQKNSIQYQKTENVKFSYREKLAIASVTISGFCTNGIISEKHSAFKENSDIIIGANGMVQYKIDRPKFHQLINLVSKKYFKGVIVLCWDRISRNKGDETIIRKIMKSGADFRFVLATYDKTSSGALHMDIDGMFAIHHSRVTSEKVSLTIRNQREKGICTYKAPVGYLNLGKMDDKPFDPDRAPLIKQMFEKYATGNWSLITLARWATQQGFTMPAVRRRRTEEEKLQSEEDDTEIDIVPVERQPTFNNISKILSNPFYTGMVLGNNNAWVKSISHKALVSEELFKTVQKMLTKRTVSIYYSKSIKHPLRGMIRCDECMRLYTPYEQKGHCYYRAKCREGCTNSVKNFKIAELEKRIIESVQKLCFTEKEIDEIMINTQKDIIDFDKKRNEAIGEKERQKKKLREDLQFLRENKLNLLKTGVYGSDDYLKEEKGIMEKIQRIQLNEVYSDIAMSETIKEVITLSELLKNLILYTEKADSEEKEKVLRIIFSELTVSGNKLLYKCRNGFEALEHRFVSVGDPTGWLHELPVLHNQIKVSIMELKKCLSKTN